MGGGGFIPAGHAKPRPAEVAEEVGVFGRGIGRVHSSFGVRDWRAASAIDTNSALPRHAQHKDPSATSFKASASLSRCSSGFMITIS